MIYCNTDSVYWCVSRSIAMNIDTLSYQAINYTIEYITVGIFDDLKSLLNMKREVWENHCISYRG